MSEQWYCPECGIIDAVEFEDGDLYTVCVECGGNVEDNAPLFVYAFLERIATLEKVAEAAAEWFGPSLQDARFETVAVIKALREAGYDITKEHIL